MVQGKVWGVAVEGSGRRYVAGSFQGRRDFDPGAGQVVRTGAGSDDAFVTCFESDGRHAWTQTFGGSASDVATGVAVADGTVYVAGHFASSNAGIGGAGSHAASGPADAFILSFDTFTGAPRTGFGSGGVARFAGSGSDYAHGVAAYHGIVFVAGKFNSTNAGMGGSGTVSTAGGYDAFVLALNATSGAAVTAFSGDGAQTFGGSGDDEANAVTTYDRWVYAAGAFQGSNAGVGGPGAIASRGGMDAFILKLDALNGGPGLGVWTGGVQTFGGPALDRAEAVVASLDRVYAAGEFDSTGAGIGGPGAVSTLGARDAFVLCLDSGSGAAVLSFSGDGVQIFGGGNWENATGLALWGGTLFVSGASMSGNAGIGQLGNLGNRGVWDACVLALDRTTGAAAPSFSDDGIQTFGGIVSDLAFGIAVFNDT
ncbi:MAG: hypothetical protein ACRDKW_17020, partial [Actinomycetota bacterium]